MFLYYLSDAARTISTWVLTPLAWKVVEPSPPKAMGKITILHDYKQRTPLMTNAPPKEGTSQLVNCANYPRGSLITIVVYTGMVESIVFVRTKRPSQVCNLVFSSWQWWLSLLSWWGAGRQSAEAFLLIREPLSSCEETLPNCME